LSLIAKISSSILFVEFFIIAVNKIRDKIKKTTENFLTAFFQNFQYLSNI